MARKKKTSGRKTTRKSAPRKPRAAAAGGTPQLETMSTEELHAELRRRQRSTASLERKRQKLLDQLAEVEKELASHGAPITSTGTVRKRPKNDTNLEEALASVLSGQVMGVSEAAEAVQRAGYMTSAANFRTIVNQTLLRSKRIKKVARGQYTAK